MALKVKAVEQLLKFTKNENNPGVYRYVMKARWNAAGASSSPHWWT